MTELEYQALILSLKVGAYAVLWLIPLGIALAWLLSRKEFIGKSILDSLIHLPLVLPPVVIGYLLLISLGSQGFWGTGYMNILVWYLASTGRERWLLVLL